MIKILKNYSKAFTLVELLVVIAIIALLASVASVVTMEVRNKGRDTRIQTSLAQVRFEAAMIHNAEGSYANLCDGTNTLNDANDNLRLIEEDVRKYSGSDPDCYATGDAYCVQASLVTSGYYCLDSSGYAGTDATNCSAANISCH